MEFITNSIQNIAILLFCGFMAVFMIPNLFFWIFYTLPQTIRYWITGKMRAAAFLPTFGRIGSWLAIIFVLYAIAFFADREVGLALFKSNAAIASWILATILICVNILSQTEREKLQKDFYENLYLRFITEKEQKKYDGFIAAVAKMDYLELLRQKTKKWNYLQEKALRNRMEFLKENGLRVDKL